VAPPAGGSGFALCHRTHKIKATAATPFADGDTELPKYVSPSNSATPPREPPVTCEGERLSFRNSIERVREDCICYGPSGIGAALTTKLVDGGAEIWIADRQIGLAQELAQRRVTQAGNDRAARVIGYPLARRTRTILFIDFVAFFRGCRQAPMSFRRFRQGKSASRSGKAGSRVQSP
jgi:hypothetical protein